MQHTIEFISVNICILDGYTFQAILFNANSNKRARQTHQFLSFAFRPMSLVWIFLVHFISDNRTKNVKECHQTHLNAREINDRS